MRYPLGSFPRYGYQARNSAIRREVAIENSAATRRVNAWENFQIEKALFSYIETLLAHALPKTEKGAGILREINERASRIRRKHAVQERVYFKYLGETLRLFCVPGGMKADLKNTDDKTLKYIARELGRMILVNPDPYLRPTPMKEQTQFPEN